ncbi:hypothetical protein ABZR52_29965, partial [Pseudomonas aeruginosa]
TPASGEPRRGLRSAAAVELLTSFCLCFLKKPVRQDGVYGAVTVDWLHLRGLLASSTAEALRQVATDARYLRLLHQGWYCAPTWATCGVPKWVQGAEEAVRSALMQEHFAAAQKD